MAKARTPAARQQKPKRHIGRWVLIIVLLILANLFIGVGIYLYRIWETLPPVHELKEWRPDEPLRIYAADGSLLQIVGPQTRFALPLDRIPVKLQEAFIAAENARFYSENPLYYPVSFPGILRAAWVDLIHMAPVQGASTIPEQVARNFYLTPQKTITRKVAEILLAYKLAQHFSRKQILELYLNKIYLGQGAYGVQAAARTYYGKNVDQLTLGEMATIAGLPPAPSYLNPVVNPELAKKRRAYVLKRMEIRGYIDRAQVEKAEAEPILSQYHTTASNSAPYVTEWIADWLSQQFGSDFTFRSGLKVYTTIVPQDQIAANRAVAVGLENYDMGLSSLDPKAYRGPIATLSGTALQDALQGKRPSMLPARDPANLRWGVVESSTAKSAQVSLEGKQTVTLTLKDVSWARPRYGAPKPRSVDAVLHPGDLIWLRPYVEASTAGAGQEWGANVWSSPGPHAGWQLTQIPQVQGALVSLDSRSGAITALVGGFSYEMSHFNRAIYAYRQPGSGFKPFVYAAAMDAPALLAAGHDHYLTPQSLIADTPLSITLPNGQVYSPTNYSNKFSSTPIPVWANLAYSHNVPSVRILMDIGIPYAAQYVQRFGFPPKQIPMVPSMVLGSGDYTPLQMARGYAVFSSGGFLPKPYLIRKIVNSNGTQISLLNCPLGYAPPPDETAIPPGVAYLMTEMMQQVIKIGTGVAAQSLGRNDIAGKTGTTNHETNAWFNGFTPKITTTVWVGYDDNRSMGRWAAGAREALPIWIHYMRTAISTRPQGGFFRPPDVAGPTESSASPVGVADYLAAYPPVAATASSESGEGSATDSGSKLIETIKNLF
ncbi:PBP1A family penicillin-binding protein [Acidithiobacillus caldus]|uniref:Penicillin-binding protein 1A n=1 Tax=Acidithiobacillus caldus (strain SM-1) TaxID=990288 RepID=F9ZN33_ACICS|nr:PBP1A family penicillin-binding protein [Acidithiobacillus caldus]AEK58076.1 Multimodular transpeptidase-transglycosylase [Acidithiobacillus caldus SM-1]AUW32726.1 PBP1A family penicillin-binding protein [Acidithiobacillus caldus]QER43122.1 penicillin-binding protein 1A [Acidithiobacillus caldus]